MKNLNVKGIKLHTLTKERDYIDIIINIQLYQAEFNNIVENNTIISFNYEN